MIQKFLVLLTLALASRAAFAAEPKFRVAWTYDPNRLILVIDSCFDDDEQSFPASRRLVGSYLKALRDWKARLGESAPTGIPLLDTTSTGACSIDITEYVPSAVRQFHSEKPEHSGPNCWDTALVMSRLVPGLRYATPEEFNFWLESPLCRRIGANEIPLAGDVVAIRGAGASELHGYIHLGDGMVWSKNGFSRTSPFALQTEAQVHATYGLDRAPRGCARTDRSPAPGCSLYANYYRCQSFESYLKTVPVSREVRAHLDYLHAAECYVSRRAIGTDGPLSRANSDLLATGLSAVAELAATHAGDSDRLLWRSIQLRARSLLEQLQLMRK